MATALKNLSDYNPAQVPDGNEMQVGIVVAEWNEEITGALLDGALATLQKHGVKKENITVKTVPGTFELTYGGKLLAEGAEVDGIILIGCVIQGDTPHFTYICQGVTYGTTELNLSFEIPFVFGVLTTNTLEQAKDRAGGKLGNKGDEAAITLLKMISLQKELAD